MNVYQHDKVDDKPLVEQEDQGIDVNDNGYACRQGGLRVVVVEVAMGVFVHEHADMEAQTSD